MLFFSCFIPESLAHLCLEVFSPLSVTVASPGAGCPAGSDDRFGPRVDIDCRAFHFYAVVRRYDLHSTASDDILASLASTLATVVVSGGEGGFIQARGAEIGID